MHTKPKTRLEELLVRKLMQSDFQPKVRVLDFRNVTAEANHGKWRLAVEAIVSCAISPNSPLHNLADAWVTANKENPLITATALDIAREAPSLRTAIFGLFDRHEIALNTEAHALWQRVRTDANVAWKEMAKACGVTAGTAATVPIVREDLFEACLRIMENRPADDMPAFIQRTAQREDFVQLGAVHEAITWYAVDYGCEEVGDLMQREIQSFAPAITNVLVQTGDLACYRLTKKVPGKKDQHLKRIERLFKLAELLTNNWNQIPVAGRQQCAERLLAIRNEDEEGNWPRTTRYAVLWRVAETLPEHEDLPDLLAKWFVMVDTTDGGMASDEVVRTVRPHVAATRPLFFTTLRDTVPPLTAARTLAILLRSGMYHSSHSGGVYALFPTIGRDHPEAFLSEIGPIIATGKASDYDVLMFAGLVGIAHARLTLASWLVKCQHQVTYAPLINLLTREVIPVLGISAAPLLVKADAQSIYRDNGYALTSQDVETDEALTTILDQPANVDSRYGSFWRVTSWRNTVLNGKRMAGKAAASLVAAEYTLRYHAPEEPFTVWLIPAVQEWPEFGRELFVLAWSTDPSKAAQAEWLRGALARFGFFQSWMSNREMWGDTNPRETVVYPYLRSTPKREAPPYWTTVLTQEPGVIAQIMTIEDERNWFFTNLATLFPHIGDPSKWAHLFKDVESRYRLKSFLVRHVGEVTPNDWLSWVKSYELQTEAEVRRHVRRYLSLEGTAALLALELLTQELAS